MVIWGTKAKISEPVGTDWNPSFATSWDLYLLVCRVEMMTPASGVVGISKKNRYKVPYG